MRVFGRKQSFVFYRAILAGIFSVLLLAPTSEALAGPCSSSNITVTRVSSPIFYIDVRSPAQLDAYVAYSITNSTGSSINDLWVKLENFAGSVLSLSSTEDGIVHVGALANGVSKTVYFYLHATGEDTVNAQTHAVAIYTTNPNLATSTCTTSFSYTTVDTIAAQANKVTSVSYSPATPELGGDLTLTIIGDTGTLGGSDLFSFTPASLATWRASSFELKSVSMTMTGGNNRTDTNVLFLSGLNSATSNYTQTYTLQSKSSGSNHHND